MKTVLAAFALLLLAACQSPPQTGDAVMMDVTGDYMHAPSALPFPAAVATFRRVSIFRRDADGKRITAAYAGASGPCLAAVTLWVDPVIGAPNLDEAYASARRELLEAYPSAVADREEPGKVLDNPGRRGDFTIDDRRLDMVVVSLNDAWYLRYRVMYPAQCGAQATLPIGEFFNAWWRLAAPRRG